MSLVGYLSYDLIGLDRSESSSEFSARSKRINRVDGIDIKRNMELLISYRVEIVNRLFENLPNA